MDLSYEIIVQGNNLKLRDGFLGLANVTLVRAPSGPILVDTGGYVTRLTLLNALKARDLTPADIPLVFLSHLHFDHSHNIDLFPDAKILVSRAEWDYVANPHRDDLFVPWGIREQLERHDLDLIDGEGQIEPGLEFFPAPGHTPGCFALKLSVPDKGLVVIAADAIKYPKEALQGACDLEFDPMNRGGDTIRRILAMADRIVPGHFPELRRTAKGLTWDTEVEFSLLIR